MLTNDSLIKLNVKLLCLKTKNKSIVEFTRIINKY